ncbi:anti-sigma factor family protein [Plebeiibacterium sediminum]|uniref:Uncharacterized protein n=1 Tax=Plebeiibacterium sediminum TaxID=2992112 RepID=A0AAE3M936_9BACT|nr:hypothetical protein [Plebeiobacterium sediminum]MCW3789261.1 hypothetical protein [Plebeiobacterium sediminum]
MMITIDNYEEWIVDYLDGMLSEDNQKQFELFLYQHPEIQKEIEGISDMVLEPESISFADKTSLLKAEASEIDIPYEEYIAIKDIETGLDENEKQWKADFINSSEENHKLFIAYQNTKLKSNNTIKFAHKSVLKRVTLLPIFTPATLRKVSAAAVIALLISIGTFPYLKKSAKNMQSVVVNDTPSLIVLPKNTQTQNTQKKQDNNESAQSTLNTSVKETGTESVTNTETTDNQKEEQQVREDIYIEPLVGKSIHFEKQNKPLNAYEIGLNAMMPIMIANNLRQTEVNELAMENHVQSESQKLSRSVNALGTGIRFINYLSGNPTTIKKYINEDGEMVAYQLESDNISFSRKIKSMPVTN